MIAQLTGVVAALEDGRCVIDVHGVGYLVQASARTLSALPEAPAIARVLIETVVREDAILLFGFADAAEREWFRLLTTVQGVGAKVALALLSALPPAALAAAIATGDRVSLGRAPGVGPKLAQRLVSELAGKVGGLPTGVAFAPAGFAVLPAAPAGLAADLVSALLNLGYRRAEAEPAVARVLARLGDAVGVDVGVRAALKELAR